MEGFQFCFVLFLKGGGVFLWWRRRVSTPLHVMFSSRADPVLMDKPKFRRQRQPWCPLPPRAPKRRRDFDFKKLKSLRGKGFYSSYGWHDYMGNRGRRSDNGKLTYVPIPRKYDFHF